MGFISNLSADQHSDGSIPAAQERSRQHWRDVFGTAKEDGHKRPTPPSGRADGGSWGVSGISGKASYKRLLQAMRSMAPGGWSDDRWEESRRYIGIIYAAIHRQNEILSQSEFAVFRKDDTAQDGKIPVKRGDPAYKLVELLEKPNNEDSFGDMLAQWNLQLDLTGMALTWMVPNKIGTPMELYCIPTSTAIPQPAVNPDFPDGYWRIQPVYPYGPFSSYPTPASAVGAAIPAQWMMRFKYPHPILRYDGYSPLTGMKYETDEFDMIGRSRHYKMRRSINPSAVLNFEAIEGQEFLPEHELDRIHAEWENEFQGPENAGKLIVTSNGGKLEEWGARPAEMDYPAGWEQMAGFILGAGFGITKQAAGMIEDSSYSTLFATLKQLYWLTLDPKVNRIAQKLTRFLAPFFGDDLIIEIRCRRIDDHEVKNGKLTLLMQAKALTKNEMRKEQDMPETEEEWGEDIAGDPSPQEKEQQEQQQQQMGAGGPGGKPGEGGPGIPKPKAGNADKVASGSSEEPKEPSEKERPDTGDLGLGALGPRKHLRKSLILPHVNGNGRRW